METDFTAIKNKFEEGILKSLWSENGQLTYVVKNGFDVNEFALLAKKVLENSNEIAHDFTGTVINEDNTASATFDYKSGWFLEGLAKGEVE